MIIQPERETPGLVRGGDETDQQSGFSFRIGDEKYVFRPEAVGGAAIVVPRFGNREAEVFRVELEVEISPPSGAARRRHRPAAEIKPDPVSGQIEKISPATTLPITEPVETKSLPPVLKCQAPGDAAGSGRSGFDETDPAPGTGCLVEPFSIDSEFRCQRGAEHLAVDLDHRTPPARRKARLRRIPSSTSPVISYSINAGPS